MRELVAGLLAALEPAYLDERVGLYRFSASSSSSGSLIVASRAPPIFPETVPFAAGETYLYLCPAASKERLTISRLLY